MTPKFSASQQFRHALGHFTTGVTIITTTDRNGRPVGITANSFNSVSLDPQLVLWSLSTNTSSFKAFNESNQFAIHVLGEHQQALSSKFATPKSDRFAGLNYDTGMNGLPLLPDYLALFQCEVAHRYNGGDHIIMVGRVLHFDTQKGEPLLFHRGDYAQLAASA